MLLLLPAFGFLTTMIAAKERPEHYSVEVGYITGGMDIEMVFKIQPIFSTARKSPYFVTIVSCNG